MSTEENPSQHIIFNLYNKVNEGKGNERFVSASPKLKLLTPGFARIYKQCLSDGAHFDLFVQRLWCEDISVPSTEEITNLNYEKIHHLLVSNVLLATTTGKTKPVFTRSKAKKKTPSGSDYTYKPYQGRTQLEDLSEDVVSMFLADKVRRVITSFNEDRDSDKQLTLLPGFEVERKRAKRGSKKKTNALSRDEFQDLFFD